MCGCGLRADYKGRYSQGASMDSIRQMLSGLQEMFAGMQKGDGMGTICIPVYVGDTLLDDVEADSGGETEAGTMQRDVVRMGVMFIPVSFTLKEF